MQRLAIIFTVLLSLGCGGTPSEIEFNFPDEESFIITHYLKVEAYEFQEGDEEACEKLLKGLPIPNAAVFRKNSIEPCNMRGAIDLEEFDSQKAIYFAQGLNKWDVAIVAGCKIATLSADKTQLTVPSAPTDNYPLEVNTLCQSVENKCELNMDCDY